MKKVKRKISSKNCKTSFLTSNKKQLPLVLLRKTQKIQTWAGECVLAKKWAINEKLSIFIQFRWNLFKMPTSWLDQIVKISAWYHRKCGLFIKDTFLSQSAFSCPGLYNSYFFHIKPTWTIIKFLTIYTSTEKSFLPIFETILRGKRFNGTKYPR